MDPGREGKTQRTSLQPMKWSTIAGVMPSSFGRKRGANQEKVVSGEWPAFSLALDSLVMDEDCSAMAARSAGGSGSSTSQSIRTR